MRRKEQMENTGKRFSKRDAWLLAAAALVILVVFVIFRQFSGGSGSTVTVTVGGEVYGTYSLDEDQEIDIKINGTVTNVLVIRDHQADMTEAGCPDQLCVRQKAISKDHETIVCLPNQVVAEVSNPNGENELDDVAN